MNADRDALRARASRQWVTFNVPTPEDIAARQLRQPDLTRVEQWRALDDVNIQRAHEHELRRRKDERRA